MPSGILGALSFPAVLKMNVSDFDVSLPWENLRLLACSVMEIKQQTGYRRDLAELVAATLVKSARWQKVESSDPCDRLACRFNLFGMNGGMPCSSWLTPFPCVGGLVDFTFILPAFLKLPQLWRQSTLTMLRWRRPARYIQPCCVATS